MNKVTREIKLRKKVDWFTFWYLASGLISLLFVCYGAVSKEFVPTITGTFLAAVLAMNLLDWAEPAVRAYYDKEVF